MRRATRGLKNRSQPSGLQQLVTTHRKQSLLHGSRRAADGRVMLSAAGAAAAG
jgi:hypothetical protein